MSLFTPIKNETPRFRPGQTHSVFAKLEGEEKEMFNKMMAQTNLSGTKLLAQMITFCLKGSVYAKKPAESCINMHENGSNQEVSHGTEAQG